MTPYATILSLREVMDDIHRGYKFEQIIREIQPWDRKPAIAANMPSEQFDGIFLWNGNAYLIESKAKRKAITPGSHDWEDFELKIRRRKNSVIGMFCSLFPVSNDIYQRSEELNKEGHFNIVLAGDFWDDLSTNNLPFKAMLEYMNLFGRIKFLAKPPEIVKIAEWCYNKEAVEQKVSDLCKKNSSTFLRRHKSPYHDNIYINREIDNQILSYSRDVRPTAIKNAKEKPKQLCLIRDYSGSGKTTLSLEIANGNTVYFGTGITANEQDIDVKIANFFYSLGDNCGLNELLSTNKPIVFVIDSLDEASYDLHRKKKEVLSVLKFIDEELTKCANSMGMATYPVLLIFTVREDYWRDWESMFEGRRKNDINKRISLFSLNEFPQALEKYSKCYNYKVVSEITTEAKAILSSPINLLIFSETYKFQGEISISEVWRENVIDVYFNRKKDDIYKRSIPGLTSNIFYNLISLIAFHIVKEKLNTISRNQIDVILIDNFPILIAYSDEVVNALVSELILVRDSEKHNHLRYRHSRFIEFLLAYYIVFTIERDQKLEKLDDFAQISFESGIVLMFRVHDDIRYIGRNKFPLVLSKIEDYYSKSDYFMTKKIRRLRSELSVNFNTSKEDLDLVLKNISSSDPDLIANAYFVVAAKSNNQPKQTVLNLFIESFNKSQRKDENYKLITKLEYHDLLINESVLNCILNSKSAKNWEVYLGLILTSKKQNQFQELWMQSGCADKQNAITTEVVLEDWSQVKRLLNIILNNLPFIPGKIDEDSTNTKEIKKEIVFKVRDRILTEEQIKEQNIFEEQKRALEDRADRLRRMTFNLRGY